MPKGKSDADEDVKQVEIGSSNIIGDSNPEKVQEIGESVFRKHVYSFYSRVHILPLKISDFLFDFQLFARVSVYSKFMVIQ